MIKPILTFGILTLSYASAMNSYDVQYNSISEIVVSEIVEAENGEMELVEVSKSEVSKDYQSHFNGMLAKSANSSANIGAIIAEAEGIIALGKEIYKIVEAGKPVVSYESQPVSVLPKTADRSGYVEAFDLENWKAPKAKKFKIEFKNYLGMTPVSFQWNLIYSYGGQKDGKGAFITGAQIKAEEIDVAWGYTFNASYKVQSITNMGTRANPVAQAVLTLQFKVETVLKTTMRDKTYSINGAGQTKNL